MKIPSALWFAADNLLQIGESNHITQRVGIVDGQSARLTDEIVWRSHLDADIFNSR
jgi:hypothetical protein